MFRLNTSYETFGRNSVARIIDSLPSLKRGGAHVELSQVNVSPRAQLAKAIAIANIDPEFIGLGVDVHLAKCANTMVCGVCPDTFLTTSPHTLLLRTSYFKTKKKSLFLRQQDHFDAVCFVVVSQATVAGSVGGLVGIEDKFVEGFRAKMKLAKAYV